MENIIKQLEVIKEDVRLLSEMINSDLDAKKWLEKFGLPKSDIPKTEYPNSFTSKEEEELPEVIK